MQKKQSKEAPEFIKRYNNKGALIGRRVGREKMVKKRSLHGLNPHLQSIGQHLFSSFTGIGSREILTSIFPVSSLFFRALSLAISIAISKSS